jgi:WD40 repeat protein
VPSLAVVGTTALVGGGETLRVVDAVRGNVLRTFLGFDGNVVACALSSDGRLGAAVTAARLAGNRMGPGRPPGVRVLDLATGVERAFGESDPGYQAVAFSPRGTFVTAAQGDRVRTWHLASGNELPTIASSAPVNLVAITPDEQRLVTVTPFGLEVWELASGESIRTVGPANFMRIVISSDGREAFLGLVSGGLARVDLEQATPIPCSLSRSTRTAGARSPRTRARCARGTCGTSRRSTSSRWPTRRAA